MKRMTVIQLAALVALVVFGAYHGARAQQSAHPRICSLPLSDTAVELANHGSCAR